MTTSKSFSLLLLASGLSAQTATVPETVVLSPFTVVSQQDSGYAASNTLSGTRMNTPLRDVPKAITILTRDFLDDTAALNIAEAVRYTSGIVPHSSENAVFNENVYTMRGFRVNTMMRDGALRVIGPTNTQGMERIEVVKGPSSILYGQTFPGGIINYISKKPLFTDHASTSLVVGSWEQKRAALDIGGTVGDRKRFGWRFNASLDDSGGWRDFEEFQILFLSPSVSWRATDRTTVNVWMDVTDRKGEPAYVPIRRSDNRGFAALPREANVNGPDSFRDQYRTETSVEVLHDFSSWFSGRLFYNYIWDEILENRAAVEQANADARTYTLRATWDDIRRDFQFAQANVALRFPLGSTEHALLAGVDLNDNWGEERLRLDTGPLMTVDLANYATMKDSIRLGRLPQLGGEWVRGGVTLNDYSSINRVTEGSERRTSWVGILQSKALEGRLNTMLGIRFEDGHRLDYNVRRLDVLANRPPFTRTEYDATTVQAGAAWRPRPELTLYSTYSESFLPNTFVNPDGERFDPQTGEGLDVGLKFDVLDGRVSGTVAWYDIDFTNILRNDPSRPNYRIASGKENSRGVEADLVFAFTRNWTGTASVSTAKSRIVSDVSRRASEGKRPENIPDTTASFWTKYLFPAPALKGLEAGLGVIHMGERTGLLNFTTGETLLPFDSYVRIDAMVAYRFRALDRDFRLALNVRNLTDEEYENNAQNFGAPRELLARLDVRF